MVGKLNLNLLTILGTKVGIINIYGDLEPIQPLNHDESYPDHAALGLVSRALVERLHDFPLFKKHLHLVEVEQGL